jgi:ADP-ribose pyrophosphatase YjhB (NUDIX family)
MPPDFDDEPVAFKEDGTPIYDNAPTVVCVAIPNAIGMNYFTIIQRARNPGKGLWALPGGFQMKGETWEECGAREVYEELNLKIDPWSLTLIDFNTDEFGHNVLVAVSAPPVSWKDLKLNKKEVSYHSQITSTLGMKDTDWAFKFHKVGIETIFKTKAHLKNIMAHKMGW